MKKKRSNWLTIWRLVIAISFCLNVFGAYSVIQKRWRSTPFYKREVIKLCQDGLKWRYLR